MVDDCHPKVIIKLDRCGALLFNGGNERTDEIKLLFATLPFCFDAFKPSFQLFISCSVALIAFKVFCLVLYAAIANKVCERLSELNAKIADEDASGLGKGFCIGHSYFCVAPTAGQSAEDWYAAIVDFEISPLLNEYWWDDKAKAKDCIERLKA